MSAKQRQLAIQLAQNMADQADLIARLVAEHRIQDAHDQLRSLGNDYAQPLYHALHRLGADA